MERTLSRPDPTRLRKAILVLMMITGGGFIASGAGDLLKLGLDGYAGWRFSGLGHLAEPVLHRFGSACLSIALGASAFHIAFRERVHGMPPQGMAGMVMVVLLFARILW